MICFNFKSLISISNLMPVDSRSVVPQAPAILQSVKIEHENIIPNQNKDARVAGVRSI